MFSKKDLKGMKEVDFALADALDPIGKEKLKSILGSYGLSQIVSLITHVSPRDYIISNFCQATNLGFANRNQGNLCFAENKEVRTEFKYTFTLLDLKGYILAHLQEGKAGNLDPASSQLTLLRIPYPKSAENFWELTQIGKSFLSSV